MQTDLVSLYKSFDYSEYNHVERIKNNIKDRTKIIKNKQLKEEIYDNNLIEKQNIIDILDKENKYLKYNAKDNNKFEQLKLEREIKNKVIY